MQAELILIGGFLGAGKTTFLREMSRHLALKGKKVGLITNDQATALVDTAFLGDDNGNVVEVSGSCFCCNYDGFMDAINTLAGRGMDTIIAEPVGSCTDLSATIMQPLKEKSGRDLRIFPLTVLVDPDRLDAVLQGCPHGLHASAAYIVRKQVEEADLIVITKADTRPLPWLEDLAERARKRYPDKPVLMISAKTGAGLDLWLEAVSSGKAGTTITEVDYDIYAQGEAVLGWLNMAVTLDKDGADWNSFAKKLIKELAAAFDREKLPVAHVKLRLEAGGESILGNITGSKDTKETRGKPGQAAKANLTINARVETTPDTLLALVKQVLEAQCAGQDVTCALADCNCLSPGRPNPTHRYGEVVH